MMKSIDTNGSLPILLLFPLLITACSGSTEEVSHEAFESLVQSERAFASTSITSGTRAAFLEFFAADGIVFDAGPVNVRTVWEPRPSEGPVLSWGPEIADVSAAGDLGYTSGPYEVKMDPDSEPVAWGHYVSVWRRDSLGIWRVVVDGGNIHGPPSLGPDSVVEWVRGEGGEPKLGDLEITLRNSSLIVMDAMYSAAVAGGGFTRAAETHVDVNARFYRNGVLPIVGRDAAVIAAPVFESVWSEAEHLGMVTAESGDLGATYGVVEFRSADSGVEAIRSASYYRIWKRVGDAPWRVVVDVLIPMAPTTQ